MFHYTVTLGIQLQYITDQHYTLLNESLNFFSSDTRMCVLICKCSFKKKTKNVAITINKNIYYVICQYVPDYLQALYMQLRLSPSPPSRFPQSIILSFLKIIMNTHRCIKWQIKTSNLILLMHVWYVSLQHVSGYIEIN